MWPRVAEKYEVFEPIAHGGFASVHLGRLRRAGGFSKIVAIKMLRPSLAIDRQATEQFLEEARISSRIEHPNVVATLDVVRLDSDVMIVMEYVHGLSLAAILQSLRDRGQRMAPEVAVSLMLGVLRGLHAAHVMRDDSGAPLSIVHRDVSPQNILVCPTGAVKVADFGIAKVAGTHGDTASGEVKGKIAYAAPEQLTRDRLDARVDVYAAAAVLWEALAGRRLVTDSSLAGALRFMAIGEAPRVSDFVGGIPRALDEVLAVGLARNAAERYASALEMSDALSAVVSPIPDGDVGAWVSETFSDELAARAELVERARNAPLLAEVRSTAPDVVAPAPRRPALIGPTAMLALLVPAGIVAGVAFSSAGGQAPVRDSHATGPPPSFMPSGSPRDAARSATIPVDTMPSANPAVAPSAATPQPASPRSHELGVHEPPRVSPPARRAPSSPPPSTPTAPPPPPDFNDIRRR